ncbi:MAG: Rid family detoxifying hydrolase [Bacillota bacterium]
MDRKEVYTDKAPAIGGPYAQGLKAGNFLFTSGQIAMKPETKEFVTGDIEKETIQVLENLKAILEEAGATLKDVVKTTIYVKDMEQFPVINDVYASYFQDNPPVRTRVEVSKLPGNVNVEIDLIAFIKD